jgi:hypothetical protein
VKILENIIAKPAKTQLLKIERTKHLTAHALMDIKKIQHLKITKKILYTQDA